MRCSIGDDKSSRTANPCPGQTFPGWCPVPEVSMPFAGGQLSCDENGPAAVPRPRDRLRIALAMRPPASPAPTALPAAHFDRNERYAYYGDRTLAPTRSALRSHFASGVRNAGYGFGEGLDFSAAAGA